MGVRNMNARFTGLFALRALFASSFVLALAALSGCTGEPTGCTADADCGEQRCIVDTGECVDCLTSADCADNGGCCNGVCVTPDTFEDNCGCAEAPGTDRGTSCPSNRPICVAGGIRVTGAELADGECASPCTPEFGGTISAVDNTAPGGYNCTCNGNDDEGTCRVPFLRADGRPHRGSDTCDPEDKCTCFYGNGRCPASSPDCAGNNGCINLHSDTDNCGLAGRECNNDATGIAGAAGICVDGGCTCDQASDCQGDGLNVDACQLVGNGSVNQCVCDDFEAFGLNSACPLQLACVTGGCQFEGTAYGTMDELLDALNIEPMSMIDSGT